MKRITRVLLAVCCAVAFLDGAASTLASFDLNNYYDWNYSRDVNDVELNSFNISSNRIRLFRSRKGQDYMLTSPMLNLTTADTVSASVVYYAGDVTYDAGKLALTMELLGEDDAVIATGTTAAAPAVVMQTLVVKVTVPRGVTRAKARLAAYRADLDNNAAVREATITGIIDRHRGDLNNDGIFDVIDLNSMINGMLTSNTSILFQVRGDINKDGVVDVVDLNLLINFILQS